MKKQELITALSPELLRSGYSPQDVQAVLETYSIQELQELFRKQEENSEKTKQIAVEVIRAQARPRVVSDPEHERRMQETYREYAFAQLFRTQILIEGKPYVAIQNEASESIIEDWLHPGEALTPTWFKKVLTEQPELANRIPWQSADALDSEKQKRVAARQLAEDQGTFNNAAKSLRTFGINQANFNVARSTLKEGFNRYDISKALAANALQLSPPSQADLDQWAAEDVQAHNQALLRVAETDPTKLRTIVKQEAEQRRAEVHQSESDRALAATRARDAAIGGFPPLPETWQGRPLDATFIRTCAPTTHKLLAKKFGNAQLTARLRGVA